MNHLWSEMSVTFDMKLIKMFHSEIDRFTSEHTVCHFICMTFCINNNGTCMPFSEMKFDHQNCHFVSKINSSKTTNKVNCRTYRISRDCRGNTLNCCSMKITVVAVHWNSLQFEIAVTTKCAEKRKRKK